MASTYNLEPQPTAKVVIHTTSGDLALELFAQQTPITTRNFLQHCIDGYYDNTIFHRLVPGFIIQGGDPTGTGSGGQSSLEGGTPFEDEFHSRLKFNRRGLLGMANGGNQDDNGSQFFVTLGKADELTGRHTMFGRIEAGNTIYNLVKMGEADLTEEEDSDRPMYPTKITSTEILVNPFQDMVKRVSRVQTTAADPPQKRKAKKKSIKKQMLSFEGDEEDHEDVVKKPQLINPSLAKSSLAESSVSATTRAETSTRKTRDPNDPPPAPLPRKQVLKSNDDYDSLSRSPSPDLAISKSEKAMEKTKAQIAALKASLRRDTPTRAAEQTPSKHTRMPENAIRGRKRPGAPSATSATSMSKEEQRSLDALTAFRARLHAATVADSKASKTESNSIDNKGSSSARNGNGKSEKPNEEQDETILCDLHFVPSCESCRRWDDAEQEEADGEEGDDPSWITHRLTFEKDRKGKDLEWKRQNDQILEVLQPRAREREIEEQRRKRRRH